MKKYVGMTSRNPYTTRRDEWENKGRDIKHFDVVEEDLTYDQAQDLENRLLSECSRCDYCEGHPGGRRVSGNVYSVYTYYYY